MLNPARVVESWYLFRVPMRFVVTGANRGIGLELARQIAFRGDQVDATTRDYGRSQALSALAAQQPERVRIHPLDVTNEASVRAFAGQLEGGPIDVVVNNAAVLGKWESLEALDFDDVLRTFDTNTLGAIRVSRALLDRLRTSSVKKLVALSSDLGSIAENRSGGAWGYRLSKAALGMAMTNFAVGLRAEGIACAVIHPGWVKTDMGGPNAPIPVEQSAAGILSVIDALTLAQTGSFFDWQGKSLAW